MSSSFWSHCLQILGRFYFLLITMPNPKGNAKRLKQILPPTNPSVRNAKSCYSIKKLSRGEICVANIGE